MDFITIFGHVAPLIVIGLVQILKKWIDSRYAPLIVIGLGGLSTLLGVGPAPGGGFVDSTINVAWVSGLATLLYDLFKKFKGGATAKNLKSIIVFFVAISFLLSGCATLGIGTKSWQDKTPKEKALAMMETYNSQYENAIVMAQVPDLSEAQKQIIRTKKKILQNVRPLIKVYDAIAAGGGTPTAAQEQEIMKLLDELVLLVIRKK